MQKSILSLCLIFGLLATLINGCAPTTTPEVSITSEPMSEESHEIYAGPTGNPAMPFIIIHQSGENLILIQDINSSNVTGSVWNSADGQSVVIYTDSNGLPTSTIIGEDVILYSNYTNTTVDVTVFQENGTSETFQVEIDTNLLNKITSRVDPSDMFVSLSRTNSQQDQRNKWFWIKSGMYMLGVVGCTAGVLTMTQGMALPALYTLATICSGTILNTVAETGKLLNIDVGSLESANKISSIKSCATATGMWDIKECVDLLISDAEEQEKIAALNLSNPNYSGLQQGTIQFGNAPAAPSPGVYAIGKEYSMPLSEWSTQLDYIEVLDNGNLLVVNLWTNNHKECAYQGDCDVYCPEENDDENAIMQLSNGTNITPIETSCTNARGQSWIVQPGETFIDWAIYPPLENGTEPFNIIWYSIGSVDNIILVSNP